MKKTFTKGAAAAFLIAATTSSVLAATDSTMQIGLGLQPMLKMGNQFKAIEFENIGKSLLESKKSNFGIRVELPSFSFSFTDAFRINLGLHGTYRGNYTVDAKLDKSLAYALSNAADQIISKALEVTPEEVAGDDSLFNSNTVSHSYTHSSYAFGLRALADIVMYSNDDISISAAVGPNLQYNHDTLELELKKEIAAGSRTYKGSHWSLDAAIGLRLHWNISESLQLRAGLFYETQDLVTFGGGGACDKLELSSSSSAGDSNTKNTESTVLDALDATNPKVHAVFDSISHNIILELGLGFNL